MATVAEIMDTVGFVLYNLTPANLSVMADRIAALNIKHEWLLEKVTRMTHNCALNYTKYTELYAQLCARVIRNGKTKPLTNSKETFLTLLIPKCRRLLYSYKTPTCGIDYVYRYQIHMVANSKFIGELYSEGILLEKTMSSILEELSIEKGYIQKRCLCIILKSVSPKLAKINDTTKTFEFVQLKEGNEGISVNNIKDVHSTRKDAEELIVDTTGVSTNGPHSKYIIFDRDEKLFFLLLLLVWIMFSLFSIYFKFCNKLIFMFLFFCAIFLFE